MFLISSELFVSHYDQVRDLAFTFSNSDFGEVLVGSSVVHITHLASLLAIFGGF